MNICGFEKLTLLNYPGYVACILFTKGCNFKCSYCQNSSFAYGMYDEKISEEEIFEYLNKRKKILDAVVISGGEPTIQKNLKEFIKKVKEMGFKVKLDTNGYNPDILKDLIDNELIDYVALDIKNTFNKYKTIIGNICFDADNIIKSIDILKKSNINYEFRTTIIKGYHDICSIKKIIDFIGIKEKYYIQNFEDSENVLDKSLESFSEEELFDIYKSLKKEYPNLKVRGLKNKLYDKEEIKNV